MQNLVDLTKNDIDNGTLNHMLHKVGIPNVEDYVKKFHEDTENVYLQALQETDLSQIYENEQELPPMDFSHWTLGLRLRLDDPIPPSEVKLQPKTMETWMRSVMPIPRPDIVSTSTDDTVSSGNLDSWLHNWTKSLGNQPPPKCLDDWLKTLIPENVNEPIEKASSAKGRLETYLYAAQKVLSKHGYDVSNDVKSVSNVEANVGMLENVKDMYFLWKTLDKNHDRKITVEDIQIMLQEMGFGFLSKATAEALFNMVDTNHDGVLQFRDFIVLMSIIKQLISAA